MAWKLARIVRLLKGSDGFPKVRTQQGSAYGKIISPTRRLVRF